MRSACAISTCVVPFNNPTTRPAISIPSYHRFSSPTDSSSCRGESDSDRLCSRRVATQDQSFKSVVQPGGNAGGYWVDFLSRGDPPCPNQCSLEQSESLPYNHHLQQFLTFLKQERGFADATIVNRERSLKPFLAWLVAQDVPLSTVSPVVITKYFTSAVAGRWKRTTVSFHV